MSAKSMREILGSIHAPVAGQVHSAISLHGRELVDEYAWLKDPTRKDPLVLDYLNEEIAHGKAIMDPLAPLVDSLYWAIRKRTKEADQTVPARRGQWYVFERTEEGRQYPIYCRRRRHRGTEEVVLDQNAMAAEVMAAGHKFFDLGAAAYNENMTKIAYTVDSVGYRDYTLFVKDLVTGEVTGPIAECVTSVAWAKDDTLFYANAIDETKRSCRVCKHRLGTSAHDIVFEEPDALFRVGLGKTRSGRYLFIGTGSFETTELRFIDSATPDAEWRVIAPRKTGVRYTVEDGRLGRRNVFFIQTQEGNADNYRVVRCFPEATGEEHWQELVPHRPDVMIEKIDVFKNHLVVYENRNALDEIRIVNLKTDDVHYVEFPEPLYVVGSSSNHTFNTRKLRFAYQSMITPPTVYEYDMDTRARKTLKVKEIANYDHNNQTHPTHYATASDGTQIPISLVYKGERKGPRPIRLYGYGSYGHNIPASFSVAKLNLLERGFILAIAHIRGGCEGGEVWHDMGKMEHKMNTFTDFIACGEKLVEAGYTTTDKLFAEGHSAGGLLMGTVLNLSSDRLFKAAIVGVPFLDVMNTMLDESLPLTVGEFLEWGNPKKAEDFFRMLEWAPYENIRAQAYPAIFCRAALWDSQVPFWEAAKWVARLRSKKTDSNPVILRMALEGAGHGGASGRFEAMREEAELQAFLLWQAGMLDDNGRELKTDE